MVKSVRGSKAIALPSRQALYRKMFSDFVLRDAGESNNFSDKVARLIVAGPDLSGRVIEDSDLVIAGNSLTLKTKRAWVAEGNNTSEIFGVVPNENAGDFMQLLDQRVKLSETHTAADASKARFAVVAEVLKYDDRLTPSAKRRVEAASLAASDMVSGAFSNLGDGLNFSKTTNRQLAAAYQNSLSAVEGREIFYDAATAILLPQVQEHLVRGLQARSGLKGDQLDAYVSHVLGGQPNTNAEDMDDIECYPKLVRDIANSPAYHKAVTDCFTGLSLVSSELQTEVFADEAPKHNILRRVFSQLTEAISESIRVVIDKMGLYQDPKALASESVVDYSLKQVGDVVGTSFSDARASQAVVNNKVSRN